MRRSSMLSVVSVFTAFFASGASAQSPYEGKVIHLILGASGGYESYARALANHLPKHIPGSPTVIVRAMPGAASMAAANHLFNVAAPDGLTIGTFVKSIPLAPMLGDKAARYDPKKFTWIGSSSSYLDDAYFLIVRSDFNIKSVDELRSRTTPLKLGSTGPSSDADIGARIIGNVLDIKFRIVRGYKGTPNIALAIEQAEMDGMMIGISSLNSVCPDWLKGPSSLQFLLQFGYGGAGRHPALPNAVRIDELARNDDDRAMFDLLQSSFKMARPFAAPPGTPPQLAKILRDGFMATHRDSAYLEETNKLNLDVSPVSGEDLETHISKLMQTPSSVVERYTSALNRTND